MKDNLMKGLCTKLGAELRKIGRADEGLGSGSFKKVSPMSSWAKDRGSRMRTGQKLSVFSTLCSPRTCPLGSEATTDLGLAGRSQEDKYLSLSLLLSVHLLLVAPIGRNQPKARWQGSLFAVDHIAHLSERREGWKKERICRGTWSLQHRPPMS